MHVFKRCVSVCRSVHEDQKRDSGEPYIIHAAAVAQIPAETGADCETVDTGFLHDTVEDGRNISVQMIADRSGEDVAFLVNSVTKIPENLHSPCTSFRLPGNRRRTDGDMPETGMTSSYEKRIR